MKLTKWKLSLIAAIGFAFSGTASAQNTQDIVVTAFVPNVCIVDVATTETTMDFDLSGVAAAVAPFDATTVLPWRCSAGYNLYTDNTFGTIWGDGTGTTSTVAIAGTGMANVGNTTVYGRIPLAAAQAATTGIYTDTVLVTVVF